MSGSATVRALHGCLLASLLFAGTLRDAQPSVPPPGDDTTFWCRPANPSCGPNRWATEWNETGTSDLVQYPFVEPGLVAEDRFVEAIWLVWQWPEGKDLLRSAARQDVFIVSDPDVPLWEIAGYSPSQKLLVVNQSYVQAFTWMLGAVLVHELRHTLDVPSSSDQEVTYEACIAVERRAFEEENRYLEWLDRRFSGLPQPGDLIEGHLTPDNVALYNNLIQKRAAANVDEIVRQSYEEQCGHGPHAGT